MRIRSVLKALFSAPSRFSKGLHKPALLAAGLAASFMVGAWWVGSELQSAENRQSDRDRQYKADQLVSATLERFNRHAMLLRAAAAGLSHHDHHDDTNWQSFLGDLDPGATHPGLNSITYIVREAEECRTISGWHRDGLAESGASARDLCAGALGETLQKAAETDQIQTYLDVADGDATLCLIAPLPQSDGSIGWLKLDAELDRMMRGILTDGAGIDFHLYTNGDAGSRQLVYDDDGHAMANNDEIYRTRSSSNSGFSFGNRQWSLEVTKPAQPSLVPALVAASGLAFGLSVFAVVFTLGTLRWRAERIVGERTMALGESEARHRLLMEQASDAILIADPDGSLLNVNARACEITGYSRFDLLAMNVAEIPTAGDAGPNGLGACLDGASQGVTGLREYHLIQPTGSEVIVEVNASLLADGTVQAIIRDITERRIAEERIRHLASYDLLTGLPNRFYLSTRLTQAINTAATKNGRMAVLFCDLDRFKAINEVLGHSVGDQLLQKAATRLTECTRSRDAVCRHGGDEFIVMLPDIRDADSVAHVADKIVGQLSAPYGIDGKILNSSVSVGIALFPEDGRDGETLVRHADAAMAHAKERGRNNYRFFDRDINKRLTERHSIEADLHVALRDNQFQLYYQPQISLDDGRLVGLEALIRWNHPEKGLISPDSFIPIAEQSGLIHGIGDWVVDEALSQIRAWLDCGLDVVPVAVNLSPPQFRPELPAWLGRRLKAAGVEHRHLVVEVTEGVVMNDAESTVSVLKDLRAMGIAVAIDDFGTGYSSLSYLRRFPIDKLKIDKSFVRELPMNADDCTIVAAMIGIARQLKMDVVAEGVENDSQVAFLRSQGCPEGQGYHFARPQPATQITPLLQAGGGPMPSRLAAEIDP